MTCCWEQNDGIIAIINVTSLNCSWILSLIPLLGYVSTNPQALHGWRGVIFIHCISKEFLYKVLIWKSNIITCDSGIYLNFLYPIYLMTAVTSTPSQLEYLVNVKFKPQWMPVVSIIELIFRIRIHFPIIEQISLQAINKK